MLDDAASCDICKVLQEVEVLLDCRPLAREAVLVGGFQCRIYKLQIVKKRRLLGEMSCCRMWLHNKVFAASFVMPILGIPPGIADMYIWFTLPA